jgi:acyl-CoA thioester hydrolase
MYTSDINIRVRYAETDKMGYVYYGNYASYYEVGRAEAMRELGMTYRQMEDKGVMMPIASMSIKYFKPAFYDDLLTIRTIVKEIPTSRMHFFYEVYNEKKELLNKGETILAFVNMKSYRPCPAPDWFMEAFMKRWNNQVIS